MGISTVIADTGRRTKRAVLALAASAAMLVAGIAAAQASCQILADSWIQPPMLAPAMTATPASLATPAALARDQVAIRYFGHATFEIETPRVVGAIRRSTSGRSRPWAASEVRHALRCAADPVTRSIPASRTI